jgi:O-antigen/teichoic acid export membrane protein
VSYSAVYGIGLVVNIFHGVVVNAAMAIADRVNGAIYSFVGNFQVAYQPMLVKSYVSGDRNLFESLLMRGIKMSFFLYFVFAIPLILNMEFILNIWLRNPPEQATIFCQWMLVNFLVVSLITPMGFAIIATGNIKNSSIANSVITSSTIVFSYVFLKFDFAPIVVLIILFAVRFACLFAYIYFMRSQIGISFVWLWKRAFSKVFAISFVSVPLPLAISFYLTGWQALLATAIAFLIAFLPSLWFIGLTSGERHALRKFAERKISTFHKGGKL